MYKVAILLGRIYPLSVYNNGNHNEQEGIVLLLRLYNQNNIYFMITFFSMCNFTLASRPEPFYGGQLKKPKETPFGPRSI